jgi:2-oxoglutarate ferredoxin oxidoreductase subunit alpha
MVLGAGWAGARSLTATSGPGISLMSEAVGYGYFTEIPAVIWDIQRMGPSTGLPTRTSQGDLLCTYYLGHGDTRHPILLPGGPDRVFRDGRRRRWIWRNGCRRHLRALSDLDMGMNLWITKEFEYPDKPLDRGKVLSAEDLASSRKNTTASVGAATWT